MLKLEWNTGYGETTDDKGSATIHLATSDYTEESFKQEIRALLAVLPSWITYAIEAEIDEQRGR